MTPTDRFLEAAIQEARQGLREGGIPIGSVIVHRDRIIGRGHNRRVQKRSAILHGGMLGSCATLFQKRASSLGWGLCTWV